MFCIVYSLYAVSLNPTPLAVDWGFSYSGSDSSTAFNNSGLASAVSASALPVEIAEAIRTQIIADVLLNYSITLAPTDITIIGLGLA